MVSKRDWEANGYHIFCEDGGDGVVTVTVLGPHDFRIVLDFEDKAAATNTYELLVGQIDPTSEFDVGREDNETGDETPLCPILRCAYQ